MAAATTAAVHCLNMSSDNRMEVLVHGRSTGPRSHGPVMSGNTLRGKREVMGIAPDTYDHDEAMKARV